MDIGWVVCFSVFNKLLLTKNGLGIDSEGSSHYAIQRYKNRKNVFCFHNKTVFNCKLAA